MGWEPLGKVDRKDSISSSTSFLGDTYILLVELVVFECENIDEALFLFAALSEVSI